MSDESPPLSASRPDLPRPDPSVLGKAKSAPRPVSPSPTRPAASPPVAPPAFAPPAVAPPPGTPPRAPAPPGAPSSPAATVQVARLAPAPSTSRPAAQPAPRPSGPPPRRIKLQHLLFLLILLPCILPLLVSSYHLIDTNRETLKTQETELLIQSAQAFAGRLSDDLGVRRAELTQLGRGLVAAPVSNASLPSPTLSRTDPSSANPSILESNPVGGGVDAAADGLVARLREPWVPRLLQQYTAQTPEVVLFDALGPERQGLRWGAAPPPGVAQAMSEAYDSALRMGDVVYRFAPLSLDEPAVVIAVPIAVPAPAVAPDASSGEAYMADPASAPILGAEGEVLVLQALVRLRLGGGGTDELGALEIDDFLLVDDAGRQLWSAGTQPEIGQALLDSDLVQDFVRKPFSATGEVAVETADGARDTLARVVAVPETGWGLVVHRSSDQAFRQVREMIVDTVLSSVLAVSLALLFALLATRWFSSPIQRLAETSHEIAAGKFDRRVPVDGLVTTEIADMAKDFNRMSEYVERYVEQLRRAAEANRALFVSSIRAFAAAIDAKDPYTRGHSERVAAYSRSIARYLGLPKDVQERVWLSAVLHDVGKIGVQDRVLQKQGVLTPEEFDQMKAHPTIGAEILEPIAALSEMIPGIRWHHEAWNGTGYPDRLKGEQIPLIARVIGVADTFDAITTNRPYQTASSPEYAIETIKKLTGSKFDAKVVTAFLLAWEGGHIQLDRQRAERTSERLQTPQTATAG